jgi:hypothetical protein
MIRVLNLVAAVLLIASVSAQGASVTLKSAGSTGVIASIAPDATESGTVNVYMAVVYGGQYFFRGASTVGWTQWTGGPFPVATTMTLTGSATNVTVVDFDISSLPGLAMYVAYGKTDADIGVAGHVGLVYTVPASIAITTTTVQSTTTTTATPTTTGNAAGRDEIQVDKGGVAIGIAVPANVGSVLELLAESTTQGNTLTIVPGSSHSSICGSAIGGGCHNFLSGSRVTWDSSPVAGKDLSGSVTFVLDNGTFVGTIFVPGGDISGSPYHISSTKANVVVRRQ